jgi:NAD(P)-dependent dehydrogenase (short-subunit alcohol dehydrogenase family)
MENPFSLKGKTILVTGASSEIGRGIAISCAGMGGNMIITGRNRLKLEETLSLMEGSNHQIIVADLTKVEDRESLVAKIPILNGVVHNAGVVNTVLCKNITIEDYNKVMTTNLESPIVLLLCSMPCLIIN